jgi:hypothetical protein
VDSRLKSLSQALLLRAWPPLVLSLRPRTPESPGGLSLSFDFAQCLPAGIRDNGSKLGCQGEAELGGSTERGDLLRLGRQEIG